MKEILRYKFIYQYILRMRARSGLRFARFTRLHALGGLFAHNLNPSNIKKEPYGFIFYIWRTRAELGGTLYASLEMITEMMGNWFVPGDVGYMPAIT